MSKSKDSRSDDKGKGGNREGRDDDDRGKGHDGNESGQHDDDEHDHHHNDDNHHDDDHDKPSLNITKTVTDVGGDGAGGSVDAAGDVITYAITVSNDGNVTLTNVVVTDTLDPSVTFVSGDDGDGKLEVGETWTYAGSYTATQADLDSNGTVEDAIAGFINNTATADSCQTKPESASAAVPVVQEVQNKVVAIDKQFVDVNGDSLEAANSVGDVINYQMLVTNAGNTALDNVVVSDPLLGTLGGPSGDTDGDNRLDVSETWTYTGSYTVTQDDLDGEGNAGADGDIDNTAAANADGAVEATDSEEVPLELSRVVAIDKQFVDVNGDSLEAANSVGDVINYQMLVTNAGNTALDNVVVSDPLLGTLGGPSGDTDGDNRLDVSETWTYTGSYTVTQDDLDGEGNAGADGDIDNTAAANADGAVEATDSEEVPLELSRVVAIDKQFVDVNGDSLEAANSVGDVINYQMLVTNAGNTALDNVVVSDPLLGTLGGPSGDTDGDNRLDVSETWTYTGSYTVTQDDLDGEGNAGADGDIDNTAAANADGAVEATDSEEVPLELSRVVAIDKQFVDVNGDSLEAANSVGDVINYQMLVTNAGNTALDNVVVSDPLLGTLGGPSGDTDGDNRLDVSETWTYTGSYTVTQDDLDGEGNAGADGDIDNTAAANADGAVEATDSEEVPLELSRVVAIDKQFVDVNGDSLEAANSVGDVINYQMLVTNAGNTALDNVVVSDPLLGTLGGPSGDTDGDNRLDVSETWTYTGSYTVTQDDLDGEGNAGADGDIDNTAAANADGAVEATDSEEVPLELSRVVAIDKQFVDVNGDSLEAANSVGDVINYQMLVTNAGNTALDNVVVSDPLLGTLGGPSGDTDGDNRLDVSETWTYTGSYTVTQDDLDGEGNAGADGDIDNTAAANADGAVEATDSEEVPLELSRVVAIDKQFVDVNGDSLEAANSVGDVINYQMLVTNAGNTALDNVVVSDPLLGTLGGPSGDTDGDNRLDVSETWTYTGSYTVTQDDLDGEGNAGADGDIDNTAAANADGAVEATDSEEVPLELSRVVAIDKQFVDVNGDSLEAANSVGDVINYQMLVTNAGNTALDNVVVSDPLLGTLGGPSGDTDGDNRLDVSETWTYTGSYTVTQDDLDGEGNAGADGDIDNTAAANADGAVEATDSEEVPLELSRVVAIDKQFVDVNGDSLEAANSVGDVINYQMLVTNAGNTALDNVVVSDPLLGTLGGPSGDTDGDNRLDVSETWTYTGSYTVTQDDLDGEGNAGADGDIDNTAAANADGAVEATDSEEVPLELSRVVAIDKQFVDVNGDSLEAANSVGDVINYQMLVTNAGNTALDNVVVSDPLLGTLGGPSGDTDGDNRLDVSETWTYTGSYTVTQDDLDGEGNAGADGDIDNTAAANADGAVEATDSETVPLELNKVLHIEKEAAVPGGTANVAGEVITYLMTVTNIGNAAIAGVAVSDPFTSNQAPVLSGGFNSGDLDTDDLLDVNESWFYTATHTVTQPEINAGTAIVNTATVTGTDATSDTDDASIPVVLSPNSLDGTLTTNTNVNAQFLTLTFVEEPEPLHSAAKIYHLGLEGQQGSIIQDVGFNINPADHYQVTLEHVAGTKAIVTDFTLEGATIQGTGNAQLEINNTIGGADSTAITAVIDPGTVAPVQAKTASTDGDGDPNTLTDSTTDTLKYLFGANEEDTLNGGVNSDVLNGGRDLVGMVGVDGVDTLNGDAGNDMLVFDNANNDSINGGTGFDLLRIDDGALALSLAGSSSDTNTLGPGNNVLVDVTGKNITGIEGILITEEAGTSTTATNPNDDVGTTVKLNSADVLNYSDTDTLHILGSPGDKVQLDSTNGSWDTGTLQPTDSQGQAFVLYQATVSGNPISLFVETEVAVTFAVPPVVLDLDGDGLEFVAMGDESNQALFDFNADGTKETAAWVAPDDGFLVYDANGDRMVNDGSEIAFADMTAEADTDLEALKAVFDSNHDGLLTAADEQFSRFGVWQDANGNGSTEGGEFKTLAEMGIVSLDLTSDGRSYSAANGQVTVHGEASFTYQDGSQGLVGDVSLALGGPADFSADSQVGGAGNDTLIGGSGNDRYEFTRGGGQDTVVDSGGSADRMAFSAGVNPLDLVLSRQANDLRIAVYGTTDQVTVQNWFGGTSHQVETIEAGNGQTLVSSQVNQLIDAMAGFTADNNGMVWDQGIAAKPEEVAAVVAASWQ